VEQGPLWVKTGGSGRAQAHLPGPLVPVLNANHYTIMEELRSANGVLTRTAMRLLEDAT
jgi:hypothetical protein